jgi:serine/threonine-protein kinase
MWMAMELLRGGSLEDRLESEGALPFEEIHRLGGQMVEALAHAHESGVVHRDFKPANVMLTGQGDVKVADFGLAALVDQGQGTKLTRPGTVMGSPAYMSPEQITGAEADAATDVYALGVTFYEMAEGSPPFQGSLTSVLTQHLTVAPQLPPPSAGDLPPFFVELIEAMLSKNAAERPSILEVQAALARP